MKQYEIRWANLPLPVGRRPVLLLSRDAAYDYLSRCIVVEITSTRRGIPQEIALGKTEGLPRPCVANFDNLQIIRKALIGDRIGALKVARQRDAKIALGFTFGWSELLDVE